ncbi:MAG: hypothetical protein AAF357_02970 [Verrucomicrobiota bacterium]
MGLPDRHIIAVYSKDDFDTVRETMPSEDYIGSSTFEEYNADVERSLEMAQKAGLEPETFKIEASDFFEWCKLTSTPPPPSEISVSGYIKAAINTKGEPAGTGQPKKYSDSIESPD